MINPVAFSAQMDQTMELLSRTVPPALRQMYLAFVSEGFTGDEALQLTISFMKVVLTGAKPTP